MCVRIGAAKQVKVGGGAKKKIRTKIKLGDTIEIKFKGKFFGNASYGCNNRASSGHCLCTRKNSFYRLKRTNIREERFRFGN